MLCSKEERVVQQALESAGMLENDCNLQRITASMTNQLYSFIYSGKKYLVRIPGKGTEYLVNRQQEAEVYTLLKDRGITDKVLYMNAENGIKITEYLDHAHVCNMKDKDEIGACIRHLRKFHDMKLQIGHELDVYQKIEEYEKQCGAIVKDLENYKEMRKEIMELKKVTDKQPREYCLCHIDPIADNFLISGKNIYLIDWEYAAMCDPLVDIAMFCIYSELDKESTDRIIDAYFDECRMEEERRKIYAYMAAGAFLWVLWAEIKRISGQNFEDYKKRQYAVAEAFSRYTVE